MRVLFVVNDVGFMDPAAIALLSGVARDLGHERFLCILQQQDISEKIRSVKPDVIAYSLNSCDANAVFKVHHQWVKPTGIFSIMGGSHPTLYPDSLATSGADAFCVGEGEAAFADVLSSLSQGKLRDDIPNIHTLTRKNEPRPLARLDTIPFPDRDLVLGNSFLANFPRKTFLTSRGCPYACTYCFNSSLRQIYKGKGAWVRRFSVNRILEELMYIKSNYRLDFVKFDDDNFAVRPDAWLEEFAERYAKEVALPFNCLIRLDSASDKLLDILEHAGCHSITTSIDSANQEIRESVLKRSSAHAMSNSDLVAAMQRIKNHNIHLFVNYITAIPNSTEEDEINTIRLSKAGGVTYSNYTALVPFYGTEIWQYCKNKGLYDDATVPKSLMRPSALKGFTRKQRMVQRSVLLLGAYNYVVPKRFLDLFINLLQAVPPNIISTMMYSVLKSWLVGSKIYRSDSTWIQKFVITLRATRSDLWQVGKH